jgi:hypothetical protein
MKEMRDEVLEGGLGQDFYYQVLKRVIHIFWFFPGKEA